MITLPEALLIVKLFPVVFIKGVDADESRVIASIVPFTLKSFVGAFVQIPIILNPLALTY